MLCKRAETAAVLPEGLSLSVQPPNAADPGTIAKLYILFPGAASYTWNQVFEDLTKRNSVKHRAHHLLLLKDAVKSTSRTSNTLRAEHNTNANVAGRGSTHNACAIQLLPAGNSRLSQIMSHLCVTLCSLLIQPASFVAAWPVFASWPHPEASYPTLRLPWKKLDVACKGEASRSWSLIILKKIKSMSKRGVLSESAGGRRVEHRGKTQLEIP